MNELAICVQNADKNVTAKETIDEIYNAGFKNVFVQYYNKQINGLTEIEQIDYCKELGLNIIFAHLGYKNLRNINEIWLEDEKGDILVQNYISDLKVLNSKGIDMAVIHLTDGPNPPPYSKIGLNRIELLAKEANKLNIRIAFENTRKQGYLEYVLDNIKDSNVGICYDSGHCHCHFKDEFNYEFFKNKIFAVHLHDNKGFDDEHLLPFDGTIDWKYVLGKIKESNYNGPTTLELVYRNNYLNEPINEFYKEAYKRGLQLMNLL